jgi:adenine-specific DNA-methyltransferase
MQKMTPTDGQSMNVVDENIAVLKKAFPESFTEDGIDFEVLRQLLGDEVAEGEEKYGLNWFGKKKARQIALTPSMGTLRPCPEESVDWDTTQNLFIEGDNLEVLKLLQKSYAGKVKVIYIDPPYNTGGEFIYPDKFQDNLDTYLRYTGQKNAEGFKVSTNTESSGRYHTNWLNMMYPRLKLARTYLANDGAIFVSIDDNELHNLRRVMDEIFGEENFVNCVSIKMSEASGVKMSHVKARLPKLKEYLLIYRKSPDFKMNPVTIPSEKWNEEYKEYLDGVSRAELDELKSLFEEEALDEASVQRANDLLSNARVLTVRDAYLQFGGEEEFEEWRWGNAWRIIQAVGSSSVKKLALKNKLTAEQDILSVLSPRGRSGFTSLDQSAAKLRWTVSLAMPPFWGKPEGVPPLA